MFNFLPSSINLRGLVSLVISCSSASDWCPAAELAANATGADADIGWPRRPRDEFLSAAVPTARRQLAEWPDSISWFLGAGGESVSGYPSPSLPLLGSLPLGFVLIKVVYAIEFATAILLLTT
jgi:hypothetical protein